MRWSVLDQVPVTEHTPLSRTAANGLDLAVDAEALGYERIWFAEHHRSSSFASTAPEIMAALALERTSSIRIGTGGILLPLYPAAKVGEVMTLLRDVHGDRVDIGVGRAAYDDPHYAAKVDALVDLMRQDTTTSPLDPASRVWVLGAGGSSAPMAGSLGAGYAHGHFFVPHGGEAAVSSYREAAAQAGHDSHSVLAVRVVTAPSQERAAVLAKAMLLWRVRKDFGHDGPVPSAETARRHHWSDAEQARANARAKAIVFGTPDEVHDRLVALAQTHHADEIMINTLVSNPEDRHTSYRLLAERFNNSK